MDDIAFILFVLLAGMAITGLAIVIILLIKAYTIYGLLGGLVATFLAFFFMTVIVSILLG